MKKIVIIVSVYCLVSMFCEKKDNHDLQQDMSAVQVTVIEISSNDLAQVLLFTRDEYDRVTIFKKDFYEENKNKKIITQEINAYKQKLEEYQGKTVSIEFAENEIGDKIIKSIKPVSR